MVDPESNKLKCAMTAESGHINFWNQMYTEINHLDFMGSKHLHLPQNYAIYEGGSGAKDLINNSASFCIDSSLVEKLEKPCSTAEKGSNGFMREVEEPKKAGKTTKEKC